MIQTTFLTCTASREMFQNSICGNLALQICSVALLGRQVLDYWNDAVGHIQDISACNLTPVSCLRCKLCQIDEGNIKCVCIIKYCEQFNVHVPGP